MITHSGIELINIQTVKGGSGDEAQFRSELKQGGDGHVPGLPVRIYRANQG